MLHFNAQGNITELVQLDMQIDINQTFFSYNIRMARTSSGKFIISGRVSSSPNGLVMGGQPLDYPMFIGCFNANGSFLWKRENNFTGGAFNYRPVINNGYIYLSASLYHGISFNGFTFVNSLGTHSMPGLIKMDTLGNNVWATNASTNAATRGNGVAVSSNHTVYSIGDYPRTLLWGSHSLQNIANQGYDIFLAKFDAATGTVLGIDSLDGNFGNSDAPNAIIADNKNNIYLGGSMGSQLYLNNDTLTSSGGSNDFFIAKYGSADCSSVVPVTITNFNATLQNKAVLCQWQTANEVNIAHFNIQRSINGTEFNTIGKTNAAGTGNNTYSYTDNNIAALNIGGRESVYYRLQNIDKDGSYTYSKIEKIQLSIINSQLSIYPNPAKDRIMVNGKGTVELYGITGNQLNHWQLNGNRIIDISNYSNGIYLMVLKENGQIKACSKLIIAR
ncbi:MAG: T9SS type A sorting domain-containing protein [Chitinophagales bacterium]|nr:T9SS type A sorting domain-containing protein [Chitinophagales bacterium]